MAEKLVRNTKKGESREWWDAVRSAASSAPKLTYELKSPSNSTTTGKSRQASKKKG